MVCMSNHKECIFRSFKKWSYQTHKTSVGLNVYFRCSDCFQWKVTSLCIFKRILLSQSPLPAKCLFLPYYISGTIRSSWRVHLGIEKEMMQYERGLCEWKGEIWVDMRNVLVINAVGIDIDQQKGEGNIWMWNMNNKNMSRLMSTFLACATKQM